MMSSQKRTPKDRLSAMLCLNLPIDFPLRNGKSMARLSSSYSTCLGDTPSFIHLCDVTCFFNWSHAARKFVGFLVILPGRQRQPGAVFQLCPVTQSQYVRFNSWVAGARVRFLPKETQQQPGIDPGEDPGHRTWNLAITRPTPRPLSYYCHIIDEGSQAIGYK